MIASRAMIGTEAKANYDLAAQAVKEGRFEDARKVELLPSDRVVIERKIAAVGPVANRTEI